jgi:hypothetical protein
MCWIWHFVPGFINNRKIIFQESVFARHWSTKTCFYLGVDHFSSWLYSEWQRVFERDKDIDGVDRQICDSQVTMKTSRVCRFYNFDQNSFRTNLYLVKSKNKKWPSIYIHIWQWWLIDPRKGLLPLNVYAHTYEKTFSISIMYVVIIIKEYHNTCFKCIHFLFLLKI